jgi:hypothetical protein
VFIFVGLSMFNGFVVIVENGLGLSWVILHVLIASAAHGKDHQIHDLDVISNNNVVQLCNFQFDGPTFIPPCKKQKKMKGRVKKIL